jgi:hypothetical protein
MASESELDQLRNELLHLQKQYLIVQEEKAEVERRYAQDQRKWKRFKQWVLLGDYDGCEDKSSSTNDQYNSLQNSSSTCLDQSGNNHNNDRSQSE